MAIKNVRGKKKLYSLEVAGTSSRKVYNLEVTVTSIEDEMIKNHFQRQ